MKNQTGENIATNGGANYERPSANPLQKQAMAAQDAPRNVGTNNGETAAKNVNGDRNKLEQYEFFVSDSLNNVSFKFKN